MVITSFHLQVPFSAGISFAIGALIQEAQGILHKKRHILKSSASKARAWVFLSWIMVGFMLNISYQSVLRDLLMKTYYEKTIDSQDDMLASEKGLLIWRGHLTHDRMASDPRLKVKYLARRSILYNAKADISQAGQPFGIEWVAEGLIL